jgi:uncharacterized protein (TIGR02646 family)
MRRIIKTHAPQELQNWCEENKEINHAYEQLWGTVAHAALKRELLEEQGLLCAYTGKAIGRDTSHVEHIKPRNVCREWEDVDYKNLVACFPADGGDVSHGFGAPMKGGWWEEAEFISPLMDGCEHHFRFAWSGHVYAFPDGHEAAAQTIDKLKLDHDELTKLRKARIDGFFGYGKRTSSRPLTIGDARTVLASIDRIDRAGSLIEYCFVLKQLLSRYIANGGTQL